MIALTAVCCWLLYPFMFTFCCLICGWVCIFNKRMTDYCWFSIDVVNLHATGVLKLTLISLIDVQLADWLYVSIKSNNRTTNERRDI